MEVCIVVSAAKCLTSAVAFEDAVFLQCLLLLPVCRPTDELL